MSRGAPGAGGAPAAIRRLVPVLLVLAGAALLLGATSTDLRAQRSLLLERFDADVQVFRTGAVEITETLRPRFTGSWNGIYRDVPVEGQRPDGSDYRLGFELLSVEDGSGEELRHETSREGRYRNVKIWVPGAEDATRTVVLRYRLERALLFHEPGDEGFGGDPFDELNLNVTGTEWPFPIQAASVEFTLPVEVSDVQARAWTGPYGSARSDASVQIDGPAVRVETTDQLDAREGLTVAAAWEAGVVERPSALDEASWWLTLNWPLLLPLLVGIGMYRLWSSRGRDPEERPVTVRYEPPEGLSPGEVGVLVDHRPDLRDVTATLVDLAVRGHLVIEEREKEKFLGLASDTEYAFVQRTSPTAWSDLHEHERLLLEALFESDFGEGLNASEVVEMLREGLTEVSGKETDEILADLDAKASEGQDDDERFTTVELSDLEDEFYEDLPDIRDGLFTRLLELKYYERRPDRVRKKYFALAGVLLFFIPLGWTFLAPSFGVSGSSILLGGGLGAAVMAGFGWFMPARTRKGARAVEDVLGFEEFLDRVEEDRYRRMITGPEMFEAYLPYAMALQVEKRWARAFEDLYTEPPTWYHGTDPTGFRTTHFVASLGDLSTRTSTAMTSSPRSSGGSGFGGGGGVSGGGVGGGGGGGF